MKMKAAILLSVLLLALQTPTSICYVNVPLGRQARPNNNRLPLRERVDDSMSDAEDGSASFAQSLSKRIAEVEQSESSFVAGLQKRASVLRKVAQAEEEFDGSESRVMELPVVCFDALLPNQTLQGSTTDPTFCLFLRSVGLGGSFVMASIHNRQRKLRRFGVVAALELVDVDDEGDGGDSSDNMLRVPTSVTFSIRGKRRCEIIGTRANMKQRIGRWRRGYDPDGEEARLGWGEERFVDKSDEHQSTEFEVEIDPVINSDATGWSDNRILILDESSEDADASPAAVAKAAEIVPLIEMWLALASDQTTYDNVDVVAMTRRKSGEPGLLVNAAALLRKVQQEIGPMPPPERPTAFAVWGASLINPLPSLGVATEIRGAVLEATNAKSKLAVLERGLIKSINNLNGTRPLNQ